MSEEMFDVVDADDVVIEQRPRSEVHARKLLHRAVHVFLFRSDGRLLIQLRSAGKDEYPSCYTSSASGHVSAGDDYDETALREMQEEIGITAELEFLTRLPAGLNTAYEHTALYRAFSDAEPVFDPEEVAAGEYVTLAELDARMMQDPARFSPPFRELFRWYQDFADHT